MRPGLLLLLLASSITLVTGCRPTAPGAASPTPAPADTPNIPEGYRGTPWGTTREAIKKAFPDVQPGKNDPGILVQETKFSGKPAKEAFFFDAAGKLIEAEVRYAPKLTPTESANLGRLMDAMFGEHETLGGDTQYQYAWIGDGTEIRLTYDLGPNVGFGPVLTYSQATVAPSPKAATPSPAVTETGPAEPGERFGAAVRGARKAGFRLVGVESGAGKLTLVYAGQSEASEISITADAKSGKLFGAATMPRPPMNDAAALRRAETAIDLALARGNPVRLTFGGPAGMKNLVTIGFADDGYVSFDPSAVDPLVSASN